MLKTIPQSLNHYREFANSIRQPIVVVDCRCYILTSNDDFCNLCSCSYDEIEGKDFFELTCSGSDVGTLKCDLISKANTGMEFEYSHPNEPSRKFMLSANSISSQDSEGILVLFFREITLEKLDEQRREDFISIASHELKTPIAIISAYSQIIEKEAKDNEAAVLRIYASKISQQSKKLVALSATLLDISAIQTGKSSLQITTFNISEVIDELAEDFSYTNKTHGIQLNVAAGLILRADKQKIIQVLNNLISNAIKYSPGSDSISIEANELSAEILISVSDKGIGIPEGEKAKLFRKFSRTDLGSQMNIQGSGLGLYICNEIIRKHNGKLSLESERGKGSTFYISIPKDYFEPS